MATGEAVDGVLLRRIVLRQLIIAAVPGEASVAYAVGEGEQHWDPAARRPTVVKEIRSRVQQFQRLPTALDLPAIAVEPERRPHFGSSAGTVLQDVYGGVESTDIGPRLRMNSEGHGFLLPQF